MATLLRGHTCKVTATCFSADGRYLLSGGDDNQVRFWDLETGTCLQVMTGHIRGINHLAISHCNWLGASVGANRIVRIWNLQTGTQLRSHEDNKGHVRSLVFSRISASVIGYKDGEHYSSYSRVSSALVRHHKNTQLRFSASYPLPAYPKFANKAFSNDCAIFWCVGEKRFVAMCRSTQEICETFENLTLYVSQFAISPDGSIFARVITRSGRNIVQFLRVSNGEMLHTIDPMPESIMKIHACKNPYQFLIRTRSGSERNSLHLVDVKEQRTIAKHHFPLDIPGFSSCPISDRIAFPIRRRKGLINFHEPVNESSEDFFAIEIVDREHLANPNVSTLEQLFQC